MANEHQDDKQDGEYEIHPLDRDYSQPVPKTKSRRRTGDGALIRLGAFGFGAGFMVLLGAAIAVSYSTPGGPLETVGSYLHQFGMVIILVAGISVIVAYRAPKVRAMVRSGTYRVPPMNMTYGRLVFLNVGAFVLLIGFSAAMTEAFSSYMVYLSLTTLLSLLASWMIVLIVWHRGFVRGYAIGVLSGLVFNGVFGLIAANGPFWGIRGATILATHLGLIQVCGLFCAAYVGIIENARAQTDSVGNSNAGASVEDVAVRELNLKKS
ncbi:MAG: hypothetical protein ACR2NZ_16985 [Rubripirellula sp.]